MKHIYSTIITLFVLSTIFISTIAAQAPQKMSYQAVVRDDENEWVVNQNIRVRISILHASQAGPIVYAETHPTVTNANGLARLVIGRGAVISGEMSSIEWADGHYLIRTDTDPTGGTN